MNILQRDKLYIEASVKFMLDFVFNHIQENDEKIYRWKLLHCILPNKILLQRWKITNNDQCVLCHKEDNYLHYFIEC